MKIEIILTLLILSILVFAVACTPNQKTTTSTEKDAVEDAVEAVEAAVEDANDMVGGACVYNEIEGTATITSINAANPSEAVIKFDFKPSKVTTYKYSNFPDTDQNFFVKGHGCCPPGDWCKKNGIKQGATIKCVRQEIEKGSCVPVSFRFSQFENENGWN